MRALVIDPETKEVDEIDIQMKANTTYTFFGSILIDELHSINKHVLYCDANALSESKKSFFIGEQLVFGKVLVVGQSGMQEVDATIGKDELKSLIGYEVPSFYKDVCYSLSKTDINLYVTFDLFQAQEKITINSEWVLYTFNMADDKTKEYFKDELNKAISQKENILDFMKKMGQLAINAAQ